MNYIGKYQTQEENPSKVYPLHRFQAPCNEKDGTSKNEMTGAIEEMSQMRNQVEIKSQTSKGIMYVRTVVSCSRIQ